MSCGIVISILGDIADDLQHFICVTVLDRKHVLLTSSKHARCSPFSRWSVPFR